MNYIVFDLEWNQGIEENSDYKMPFEIIEIGAIKLNKDFVITDTFHILIKPQLYKEMSYEIGKVVPLQMEEIQKSGVDFQEAVERFQIWCGTEDYRFCTWGEMDVTELQRNMDYYEIPILFRTPVFYYDIQKIFGLQYPTHEDSVALDTAVASLGIPASAQFHRAYNDAKYTAEILMRLDKKIVDQNFSVDCYRSPQTREEELYLRYPGYIYYLSREFRKKEDAIRDSDVKRTWCYVCGRNAKRIIRWYAANNHRYYCLAQCEEHGYILGRIMMRKKGQKRIYVEKFLKMATADEAKRVRTRQEELRQKRREKKKVRKEKKELKKQLKETAGM